MSAICFENHAADHRVSLEGVDKPFSRWKGASGASYIFSAYTPEAVPHYPHVVYVVVSSAGTAPSLVTATNSLPDLLFLGEQYQKAVSGKDVIVYVHVPGNHATSEFIAKDIDAPKPKKHLRKSMSRRSGSDRAEFQQCFLASGSRWPSADIEIKLAG